MSKAVKKVLTVAAAVAVAYFAPGVAAGMLQAGASTAAKVVATAAVNAAGNAAIAAATGGDVGKAAITGAITGGIRGYMVAAPADGAAAAPPTTAPPAAAAPSVATGATPAVAGLETVTVTAPSGGGFFSPTGGAAAFNTAAGGAAGTQLQGVQVTGKTVSGFNSAADLQAGRLANNMNSANLGTRALATLQTAGQELVTKFTDPKAIADMTLRAAGQLAGGALVGSGLSPAEEKLLAAQAADLEELKRTNQDLYNLRLEQAKAILGEAARDYGFEEESRAKVRGAGLTTQAVRGLTGERRRVELARQQRARAEEAATGRTRGAMLGAERTQQARMAGLQMLPAAPQTSTMAERDVLGNWYSDAEERRKKATKAAGSFFGDQTGQRKTGLFGSIV